MLTQPMAAGMDSSSPFSKHLNTNFAPSHQEKNHITELIVEREGVAGGIDDEIAQAEQVLAALKQRRAVHTKYVQEHKALLSPIRQVPHDILTDIFLDCLPEKKPTSALSSPSPTRLTASHPAVVISQVCRQWRQLAFRTRLLWTHIDIVVPQYPLTPRRFYRGPALESKALADQLPTEIGSLYREKVEQWESRVQHIADVASLWIERAAPCPLSVWFRSPLQMIGLGPIPEDGVRYLTKVIDVLCEASPRWKEVRFHLFLSASTTKPLARLLNRSPDQVPLLEKVFLFVQDSERRPKLFEAISNSGIIKSESLQSFTLPVVMNGISNLPVEWGKLTELSIGAFDAYDVFDPSMSYYVASYQFTKLQALTMLKMCPNLVKCSLIVQTTGTNYLSDPTVSSTEWNPGEVISLPELQSLTIKGSSKVLLDFPPHLDLPAIRKLDIACSTYRAEDKAASGLVLWITTFGAHLEDLTFNYGCVTQSALEHCLHHLPNVVNLTMHATRARDGGRTTMQPALFADSLLRKFIPITPSCDAAESSKEAEGLDLQCYAPKLQRLECKLGHVGEFDEKTWLDFLESRRTQPGGKVALLKEASIRFYLPKATDFMHELAKRNVDTEDFVLKVDNPKSPSFLFETHPNFGMDESALFQYDDWYHPDGDILHLADEDQHDWDPTDDSDDDDPVDFNFAFGLPQVTLAPVVQT